ncbi:nuclear receptor corepressor 1 [Orussus abietinus]|uniref:nuclear receptor corepressor 1 n=1 Tax=Orussus abietinus TaxID=222816 RepID=UPI000C715C37|nr:nuclear receptor corepressor 1 [Orussus abietinus]
MWLLVLAGLLAVSAGKEAEKTQVASSASSASAGADDLVMLEIDVKEPVKRSPISASAVYGASPSQYIIRHGDDAQELSPEYLTLVSQYTQSEPQAYSAPRNAAPQRRPLPAYARQQQQLQQAYQNQRVPAVSPPRPRVQLHSDALARAEAVAEVQAQADAQSRAEALHLARLQASPSNSASYQVSSAYSEPKLGTFEQELLQLVSANQAQEFKLASSKRPLKGNGYPQYSQQVVGYPAEYAKPAAAPEQYHIETTAPRYQQPVSPSYQTVEEPVRLQYHQLQVQAPEYQVKSNKPFRPSPQYTEPSADEGHLKLQQAQARAEADAIARAQSQAEAQALAFQKVAQDSHNKHQQAAFEQIRLVHERYQQQSALEQIQEGAQVSEAGRAHIEEQTTPPKDHEAAYKAQLKAQNQAEVAAARRAQEAAEYKAHADAILKLQAQQQQHLKAQEDAHNYALNFESNQLRAQAQAQAIAQAQAEALYKAHQQARAKAQGEAQAAARAQAEARKRDPDNTPVVQYLLPNSVPLPSPNSYFTSDQVQKYQSSAGSSYVPRSAPKSAPVTAATEEQVYTQAAINQPRQAHKLKIPSSGQSSIYVSQSGLLKKSPVKSLTIEEIIEQDQLSSPQVVRLPNKGHQVLTQEDLAALINAGFTVTPVPETNKPTQQPYATENSSAGYYAKKQRSPAARPDYENYDQISAIPRQRRPVRKNPSILKQEEAHASEKVTYLVPLEPAYGTRQTPQKRSLGEAEE